MIVIPEPPQNLIKLVGGSYKEAGQNAFDLFLRNSCVTPRSRVLDVGSGCGRVAVHFLNYLDDDVEYNGFDANKSLVDWCNGVYPSRFKFQHIDLYNSLYNPVGKFHAESMPFPYPDASFDFVYLGSVFTHMLPKELENYVREINRVLAVGGVCVASFFLMNADRALLRKTDGNLSFQHALQPFCWLESAVSPHNAVAYDESYVDGLIGNQVKKEYGFQDFLIWRKE